MADRYLQMRVAYLMQLIIVVYMSLVIRHLCIIPEFVRNIYHRKQKRGPTCLASIGEKLSRHMSIAMSVLVDFQEAQCFFVISVQVAVLLAFGKFNVLRASSLAQLQTNYTDSVWISALTSTSVTYGLWALHRSKLDSAYIHIWSMVCIILSGITVYRGIPEEPSLYGIDWADRLPRLDKCGHHPPPLIYCSDLYEPGSYPGSRRSDPAGADSLSLYFAICGILGIQKIASYVPSEHRFWAIFTRFSHAIQSKVPPRTCPFLASCLRVLVEIYFFLAIAVLLGVGMGGNLYNYQSEPGKPDNWSFGQIIAVTIWVPVIIKYLYWAVCKWTTPLSSVSYLLLISIGSSRYKPIFRDAPFRTLLYRPRQIQLQSAA